MPFFTSAIAIGLLAMICGGVLMTAKEKKKVAFALLIVGFMIVAASLFLIKMAVESM